MRPSYGTFEQANKDSDHMSLLEATNLSKQLHGTLEGTLKTFDKDNEVLAISGAHSKRSTARDLKILKQLQQIHLFQCTDGKKYKPFTNLRFNML